MRSNSRPDLIPAVTGMRDVKPYSPPVDRQGTTT